jgi:trans-aconitate methyltransferase
VDEHELSEVLDEQARYYRAFAATYDLAAEWESDQPQVREAVAPVYDWFERLPIEGRVLELGCGTGLWTQRLARRAQHVYAVDVAPEMLERAQARLSGIDHVSFELADLYRWRPTSAYDVVFSSFVLSHVPPHMAPRFWHVVSSSLADGGMVVFVDDAPSRRDVEHWVAGGIAQRTLDDGTQYRIVKILPTPDELLDTMAAHGLEEANVTVLGDAFLGGVACRGPRRDSGLT